MSEKVLGLRKKDVEKTIKDWKFEAYARFPSKEERYFMKTVIGIKNLKDLFEQKQVPVRLASESVSVEWLEKEIDSIKEGLRDTDEMNKSERLGIEAGLNVLLETVHLEVEEKE